jgi:ribosomal protein S18 acetylase RimI-like enzyme
VNQKAVRVRIADERDAPVLAELHRSTAMYAYADIFPADAPPPELAQLINDWTVRIGPSRPAAQACFVAATRSAIVGVVIAGPAPGDPSHGHLSRLYVEPMHWGRGIGRLLHDHAVAHLREHDFRSATLWVLEKNTHARRWYEQLGWRPTGHRLTTFAPGGVDDVGYQRSL